MKIVDEILTKKEILSQTLIYFIRNYFAQLQQQLDN